MEPVIELRIPLVVPRRLRSLGVYLGSFDPLHRAHEWIAAQLLGRCDAALMLVPARHFHKEVRPGRNATLAQRMELLAPFCAARDGRVGAGLTREVLFLELRRRLAARFPGADLLFGMGDETFSKLVDSPTYYARLGRVFGPAEARELAALLPRVMVFGRSRSGAGLISVPSALRRVSSTRVRALVRTLRARRAGVAAWRAALLPLVSEEVLNGIRDLELYPPADVRGRGRG